jgi:hypothetical protein
MKRLLASLVLIVAAAALSGCYYDPGYSYVRGSGYSGDAYYGDGGNAYYVAPGYYDGYYGGYYGCCYAPGVSVGVSSVWYGGSRYRHDGYRDHRDYRSHAGQWRGHGDGRSDYRGGSRDGNRQRRDSRSGDRDHRH